MKSTKHLSVLVLFSCLWSTPQSSMAKIANCPAIDENNIRYRSHGNFVEASYSTHNQTNTIHPKPIENKQILWHTKSLENDKVLDPHLEADVQFNIACVQYTTDKHIIATDKRNRRFILDKQTGKLLQTQIYELLYNLRVNEIPIYHQNDIAKLEHLGDYLFALKRIDYINQSSLAIYKNDMPDNYDVVLNMPNNAFYLLAKQTLKDTLNLLKDFEKDKTINTEHWVKMTAEQMTDWHHKTYIQPKLLQRAN